MNNLVEIKNQIEKLQKQAIEIKAREFKKTVQEIHAMMQAFGITLKDLQLAKGRKGKVKTKAGVSAKRVGGVGAGVKKKNRSVVAAKYRGPNGETWSGRGLMPRWMAALVAQGKSKESFAVQR